MSRERRYVPSRSVFMEMSRLSTPSAVRQATLALMDHGLIWIPAGVSVWLWNGGHEPLAVVDLIIGSVTSARGMRGLECLVHDASHSNWNRKAGWLNDALANLLCAVPVLSTVAGYRASHTRHHNEFATVQDPDFIRHHDLALAELDRSHPLIFLRQLVGRFVPYSLSWWIAIGTNPKSVAMFVLWHACFLTFCSMICGGIYTPLVFWLQGFALPFLLTLPILRFTGETAEHDYEQEGSVEALTYSNIGLAHRLIFHPHNDGLHTLHHRFPQIPHYRLPELDTLVRTHDGEAWRQNLRTRVGMFNR